MHITRRYFHSHNMCYLSPIYRGMSRPKCYFMVWSPLGYHLEIVSYDPEFWTDLEVLLSTT